MLVTTQWPLKRAATSPHLSGFVFYGCLESLTELSALWWSSDAYPRQIMACHQFRASHYLHQCWFTVNWSLGNKLQWNFTQNRTLIFTDVTFKIVSAKRRPCCPFPKVFKSDVYSTFASSICSSLTYILLLLLQYVQVWSIFCFYCFNVFKSGVYSTFASSMCSSLEYILLLRLQCVQV